MARRLTKPRSRASSVTSQQSHPLCAPRHRDAIRALASEAKPSKLALSRVMSKKPVAIDPSCNAIDALRMMCDGGFRHLPVVDKGKLIGVVSRSDFTGCEVDHLEEEEHLYECLR